MVRRSFATTVAEVKLEPITVGGEIVARRGVGARFKVEADGQTIELMVCGPSLEAVRAACDAFHIEHDPKHSGEVLLVRPSFFDQALSLLKWYSTETVSEIDCDAGERASKFLKDWKP